MRKIALITRNILYPRKIEKVEKSQEVDNRYHNRLIFLEVSHETGADGVEHSFREYDNSGISVPLIPGSKSIDAMF